MASNDVPMRVTAYMRSGIVSDEWFPLDGILLSQWVRDDLGVRDVTVPGASLLAEPKGEPMRGGRMPIKVTHNKDWYYHCSWAEWGPYVDGTEYWNKRFDNPLADLIEFDGRRGKIDTSAAMYKAYRMPMYYRSALWVRWYLVGDIEKIRYLLATVTHIGKKISQGWGRVAKWEVDEVAEDWSIWRDGKLMRGIPVYNLPKDVRATRRVSYGVRPPYWDKRNHMELVVE